MFCSVRIEAGHWRPWIESELNSLNFAHLGAKDTRKIFSAWIEPRDELAVLSRTQSKGSKLYLHTCPNWSEKNTKIREISMKTKWKWMGSGKMCFGWWGSLYASNSSLLLHIDPQISRFTGTGWQLHPPFLCPNGILPSLSRTSCPSLSSSRSPAMYSNTWNPCWHALLMGIRYFSEISEWTLDYPPFFAWFERILAVGVW